MAQQRKTEAFLLCLALKMNDGALGGETVALLVRQVTFRLFSSGVVTFDPPPHQIITSKNKVVSLS